MKVGDLVHWQNSNYSPEQHVWEIIKIDPIWREAEIRRVRPSQWHYGHQATYVNQLRPIFQEAEVIDHV